MVTSNTGSRKISLRSSGKTCYSPPKKSAITAVTPLLALRLLIHIIAGIDADGKIHICARQLSKKLDVNYDTVTKCLKYLREIGAMRIER
jgi:NADH/NAD ratio-sensing transcriptional regulator Rex